MKYFGTSALSKINFRNHGQLVGTLSGHTSWVLSVAFSPDNEHFVSSSADHTVRVWKGSTRQCIHTFSEHTDQVLDLIYIKILRYEYSQTLNSC